MATAVTGPTAESAAVESAQPVLVRMVRAQSGDVPVYLPVRVTEEGVSLREVTVSAEYLAGVERPAPLRVRLPRLTNAWDCALLMLDAAAPGTTLFQVLLEYAAAGRPVRQQVAVLQLVVEPQREQRELQVEYAVAMCPVEAEEEPPAPERWSNLADLRGEPLPLSAGVIPDEETVIVHLSLGMGDAALGLPRVAGIELEREAPEGFSVSTVRLPSPGDRELWQVRLQVHGSAQRHAREEIVPLLITSSRPDVRAQPLRIAVNPGRYGKLRVEPLGAQCREPGKPPQPYLGRLYPAGRRVLRLRLSSQGTLPVEYNLRATVGLAQPLTGRLAAGAECLLPVPLDLAERPPGRPVELTLRWNPVVKGAELKPRLVRYECLVDCVRDTRYCGLGDRLLVFLLELPVALAGALVLVALWRIALGDYGIALLPLWLLGGWAARVPHFVSSWLLAAAGLHELLVVMLTLSRGRTLGMYLAGVHVVEARYGLPLTGMRAWARGAPGSYAAWISGGLPLGRLSRGEYPPDLTPAEAVRALFPVRRLLRALFQVLLGAGLLSLVTVPWHRERASVHDLLSGTRLVVAAKRPALAGAGQEAPSASSRRSPRGTEP